MLRPPFASVSFLALALFVPGLGQGADVPPAEQQIAAALAAAPEDRRDGATVLGFSDAGDVVELRAGSNDLICLSADPNAPRFSVACYHEDLEPFMARGRELIAEGVTGNDRRETRFAEIEEGSLKMPRSPRTLYVLHGEGFDAEAGEVKNGFLRWVIYVPYATGQSTGLPTKNGPGPWLMDSGTAGAHIMITPPRN